MIELTYSEAHKFVEQNAKRGYFWNGWDIVRWVPNENGFSMRNGMFKNGRWGISFTSTVTDSGTWKVKSVK